jgi:hypothetical protein
LLRVSDSREYQPRRDGLRREPLRNQSQTLSASSLDSAANVVMHVAEPVYLVAMA